MDKTINDFILINARPLNITIVISTKAIGENQSLFTHNIENFNE